MVNEKSNIRIDEIQLSFLCPSVMVGPKNVSQLQICSFFLQLRAFLYNLMVKGEDMGGGMIIDIGNGESPGCQIKGKGSTTWMLTLRN